MTYPEVYLASASRRRAELLTQLGVPHRILEQVSIDESMQGDASARDYVMRMAREKSLRAAAALVERGLEALPIITADTTVCLHDQVYGKPESYAEARAMLQTLSANSHQVLTAVALSWQGRQWLALSSSTVRFAPLSAHQIEAYCASGEPFDKAGGYGIQGRAAAFIAHLAGSYSGVMGLPLHELHCLFEEAGLLIEG